MMREKGELHGLHGYMVTWVTWLHGLHGYMGYMVTWVTRLHGYMSCKC